MHLVELQKHDLISSMHLQKGHYPDLVATSGDYLRVWAVNNDEVRLEALLNNVSSLFVIVCVLQI